MECFGRALAFWLIVVACACAPGANRTDVPGDVLIVTLDTARADRFSYAGPSSVTTAATDAVAAEGAAFLTAVAPSPITLVSHSSLFTGQDPFVHGVRNNGDFALAAEALTLAEVLADQLSPLNKKRLELARALGTQPELLLQLIQKQR